MIFSVCILAVLLNYMLNTYNRLWVTRMLFMPTAITGSLMFSWKREYKRKPKLGIWSQHMGHILLKIIW